MKFFQIHFRSKIFSNAIEFPVEITTELVRILSAMDKDRTIRQMTSEADEEQKFSLDVLRVRK